MLVNSKRKWDTFLFGDKRCVPIFTQEEVWTGKKDFKDCKNAREISGVIRVPFWTLVAQI